MSESCWTALAAALFTVSRSQFWIVHKNNKGTNGEKCNKTSPTWIFVVCFAAVDVRPHSAVGLSVARPGTHRRGLLYIFTLNAFIFLHCSLNKLYEVCFGHFDWLCCCCCPSVVFSSFHTSKENRSNQSINQSNSQSVSQSVTRARQFHPLIPSSWTL